MKTDAQMNAAEAARIRKAVAETGDAHLMPVLALSDAQLLRLQYLVGQKVRPLEDIIGR